LTIADGLDLALRHRSQNEDSENILQVIDMTRGLLGKRFTKYEVEALDALAQPLDTRFHESIGMVRNAGVAPNMIVRVELKGDLFGGKQLHPALVLIASR
jgi:molecular chaperone GrpE